MADDNTSAVHAIDDEVRRDLGAARRAALQENDMGEGGSVTNRDDGNGRRGWLTVSAIGVLIAALSFFGGVLWDAGGIAYEIQVQRKEMETGFDKIDQSFQDIRLELRELRSNQKSSELASVELRGDLTQLSRELAEIRERAREDRANIQTLLNARQFRLAFEEKVSEQLEKINPHD